MNKSTFDDIMNRDVKYLGELKGGFSNASKLVFSIDGVVVVIRELPAKKIPEENRRSEIFNTSKAGAFNCGPKVYCSDFDQGDTEYVSEFIDGRVININDINSGETLHEIAKILKSLHDRPLADGFSKCKMPFERIGENINDAKKIKGLVSECVIDTYDKLMGLRKKYLSIAEDYCNCHHDIQFDNIMMKKNGQLVFIDWEFSGEGNRYDDLGMSIMQFGLDNKKMSDFLECYFGREATSSEIDKVKVGILNQYLLTCSWALSTVYKICVASELFEFQFDLLEFKCEYKTCAEFLEAYMNGVVKLNYEIDAWLKLAKVCLNDFNDLFLEFESKSPIVKSKYSPRLFRPVGEIVRDDDAKKTQCPDALREFNL